MHEIKLRYHNQSFDIHNENVLIFLRNEVKNAFTERFFAWEVIKNCGYGLVHPFVLPFQNKISIYDSYGNHTAQQIADPGDQFEAYLSNSGTALKKIGNNPHSDFIEVINSLKRGTIGARIFKNNKTAYIVKNIVPGQKAVVKFRPGFFVATISQIEVGEAISSAVVQDAQFISVDGLECADLVKRGGGPGTRSTKITFSIENEMLL